MTQQTDFITLRSRKIDPVPLESKSVSHGNLTFYVYNDPVDEEDLSILNHFLIIVGQLNLITDWGDFINNLINKSPINAIDFILLIHTASPTQQNEEGYRELSKLQNNAKRLKILIIFTGIIHMSYIMDNNYCLLDPILTMKMPLDNNEWILLKKESINTCKAYLGFLLSRIEHDLGIVYDKPNLGIVYDKPKEGWFTDKEKALLNRLDCLRSYVSPKGVTFRELLDLLVNNPQFINNISRFNNGEYVKQIKGYLAEMILWFRLIDICYITIRNNPNLFKSDDLSSFMQPFKQDLGNWVTLDKGTFNKKTAGKVLYLLHDTLDKYIYPLCYSKLSLIAQILQNVKLKKKGRKK